MDIDINKKDVEFLNKTLNLIIAKQVINTNDISELCDGDRDYAVRIRDILLHYKCAFRRKYYEDVISESEDTRKALSLNFFENLYQKRGELGKKESKEIEKITLEINKLKRDKYLGIAAIILSLIALIVSIIK